ncbi:MAG: sulfatase/phosphatase domain-containing protein, partial [Verrucomicrobiales bacterium]
MDGASGGGSTGKWIGHKGQFLEGGIRVPAIISYPAKLPKGEVRDQIVTAMDWYPTILKLCGVEAKPVWPKLDGHNILPLIDSAAVKSNYKGCSTLPGAINGLFVTAIGNSSAVKENPVARSIASPMPNPRAPIMPRPGPGSLA